MTEAKEVKGRESAVPAEAERTRAETVYVPAVDILETGDQIVVTADMPGVDPKDADVTVENNVLTIEGRAQVNGPDGQRLAHAEFGVGDFRRVFELSFDVEKENIQASVRNGVLRVVLPKAKPTKTRRIPVAAG